MEQENVIRVIKRNKEKQRNNSNSNSELVDIARAIKFLLCFYLIDFDLYSLGKCVGRSTPVDDFPNSKNT